MGGMANCKRRQHANVIDLGSSQSVCNKAKLTANAQLHGHISVVWQSLTSAGAPVWCNAAIMSFGGDDVTMFHLQMP